MKRPERPTPRPPAPAPKVAAPRQTRDPAPARPPAPARAPERSQVSAGLRPPARAATTSARRAERLRRRYEKAEVKRFTRRARRRRIGWATALGIVGLVGALIAVAVFSPILALREIRVDGTVRLDPAVVAQAVADQKGTPLALLDDGRIRDELAQFPSIRSYVTELVPPGTLVIHLVERSPLGVIATGSGFDTVDAAGVVLASAPTRPTGLPLLTLDADGIAGEGFAAMAAVLVALPPDVLAQVDAITARTRDDVTLTLTGSAQTVVWGSADDSDRKAKILAALLARFGGSGAGEYDVSAPGSAVFRQG